MIFPSLCVPATADGFAEAAAAGGFSTGEIRLMTQADPAYTVKFRSLELLQALKSRLFGKSAATSQALRASIPSPFCPCRDISP